jgi:hypothetical protein
MYFEAFTHDISTSMITFLGTTKPSFAIVSLKYLFLSCIWANFEIESFQSSDFPL